MKRTENSGKYRKIQVLTAIFCFCFLMRADAQMTGQQVAARLQKLIDRYDYTIENWEYRGMGQCHAFANMIFDSIFDLGGEIIGSFEMETDYVFQSVHPDVMCVGTLQPDYRIPDLEQLLNKAVPGDFLQVKRRNKRRNGHSMIVVQIDASGKKIKVFDANTDGINTAMCHTLSYGEFYSENQAVSLYHYIDYEKEEDKKVEDKKIQSVLPNDFSAYLIQNNTGFYITNAQGTVNADFRKEDNSQYWHFERLTDGSYRISSCLDGKVLGMKNPENRGSSEVQCTGWQDTPYQRWKLKEENGVYFLSMVEDNRVLSLSSGSVDRKTGKNVIVREVEEGKMQGFRIEIIRDRK